MKKLKFILFFFVGILFAVVEQSVAQQHFPPSVSEVSIHPQDECSSSAVDVSFDIRHGYETVLIVIPINWVRFTTETTFTATLHRSGKESIALKTFTTRNIPARFSTDPARVTETLNLPADLSVGEAYSISIQSNNPGAGPAFSKQQQATGPPQNLQAGFDTPECIGGPVQLSASAEGHNVSYRWSGPNGFTSNEQHPVIPDFGPSSVGTYRVVATSGSCVAEPVSIHVNPYPANPGDPTLTGKDSWIGHVYDGINFEQYIGSYSESVAFDQNFGGDFNCFELNNGYSLYPETFSVRYLNHSSLNGLYAVDIGSDDGSRLSVDGKEVYRSWEDQSYLERRNVLLSLSGDNLLELDYFERYQVNRIKISEFRLIMENELVTGLNQEVCTDSEATTITGDVLAQLPSGISPVGSGYQWVYSKDGGPIKPVKGATGAYFTPNLSVAPFNQAGSYEIFREVRLRGSRNLPGEQLVFSHRSNASKLVVSQAVTNNEIAKREPVSGEIYGVARRGTILRLEAPEGTVFTEVLFASFGDPSGSDGNYREGFCHYEETLQVIEDLVIGQRTVEIFVGEPTLPSDFGLLCELLNLFNMRLAVTLKYEEVSETSGVTILGSIPQGGNGDFTYRWESSTQGPDVGFTPAVGNSSQKDYHYSELTTTTWFRRVVTSGNCSSISNVIKIEVENNVWTGAVDENWNNPANWSLRLIPGLHSTVLIPQGAKNFPIIKEGNNAKVFQLNVDQGATLGVQQNWLQVAGGLSIEGVVDAAHGSIAFVGDQRQEIPATAFQDNLVQNLLVDNHVGVHSLGDLNVSGILDVEKGELHTGDALTLLSTQENTALIDGSGTGRIKGKVRVQRYLDPAFGYTYISSPLRQVHVGDFDQFIDLVHPTTGFPHFYRYDEARTSATGQDATGWVAYTDPQKELELMRGYALNLGQREDPVVLELEGEVNNGSYTVHLENHHGEFTNGFHLVGNPYFSPIDWDSRRGWEKLNIDDAIYFFVASEDDPYTGTYTSYVNKISSSSGENGPIATNIIPSMQGFFVHVSEGNRQDVVRAKLGMNNAVRTTGTEVQFFTASTFSLPQPMLRLSASTQQTGKKDPLVIYFDQSASSSFEQHLDALKMMNTDPGVPNFYSLSEDGKELSISAQRLDPTGELQKIPLGFSVTNAGFYTLQLEAAENLPGGINVYLVDLEQRVSTNITQGESYSFQIGEGRFNDRFELQLSQARPTSSAQVYNDLFSVHAKSGRIVVDLNLDPGSKGRIYVNNLNGQILDSAPAVEKERVEFTRIAISGVYVVTLEVDGEKHAKKVLLAK